MSLETASSTPSQSGETMYVSICDDLTIVVEGTAIGSGTVARGIGALASSWGARLTIGGRGVRSNSKDGVV